MDVGWMCLWMEGCWMDGLMDGWMNGQMDGCIEFAILKAWILWVQRHEARTGRPNNLNAESS